MSKDKTDISSVIDSQIAKARDVDSESLKPKITNEVVKRVPNETPIEEKDKKRVQATKSKPDTISSEQHKVLLPFMRSLMVSNPRPETSTFTPSPYMMYWIVHCMDEIIRKNTYFKKQEDAWHPLISRIYFGVVFIIQVIKCEIQMNVTTAKKRKLFTAFTKRYPLENLMIPGPLVTLFEALRPVSPSNSNDGPVTPSLPEVFGPPQAKDLILYNNDNCGTLLLPNIPMLIGFANTITTAAHNNVPHYAVPTTFDDTVDRLLNGHTFLATAWTETERSALMTPGMLYQIESDDNIDSSFNTYGKRLNLPVINANLDISNPATFMGFSTDESWFSNLLPIMASYSSYFRDSRSLSECKAETTSSPLISNVYAMIGMPFKEADPEKFNKAFPPYGPFKLTAKHTSTEITIPPASSMIAQAAQLNPEVTIATLGPWSHIGETPNTRRGPYWTKTPVKRSSLKEDCYLSLPVIVTNFFALTRPERKQ